MLPILFEAESHIVNSQVCSIQDFLPSKSLPILLPLKKTFVTPYF